MSKKPDYQQALYAIIRAMEIMANSLTSTEHTVSPKAVPDHGHVAIDEGPRDRALDHLRSAADLAVLDGFMFDYIPFGAGQDERSQTHTKATGG